MEIRGDSLEKVWRFMETLWRKCGDGENAGESQGDEPLLIYIAEEATVLEVSNIQTHYAGLARPGRLSRTQF